MNEVLILLLSYTNFALCFLAIIACLLFTYNEHGHLRMIHTRDNIGRLSDLRDCFCVKQIYYECVLSCLASRTGQQASVFHHTGLSFEQRGFSRILVSLLP